VTVRRGLPTWATALVVLALAGVATFAVVNLRQQADLDRGEQLSLERLRSLTNEQSSLEWQAVAARGAAAELSQAIRARRKAMDAELASLSALGRTPPPELIDAVTVHQRALDDELHLLAVHRFDDALGVGERRVDPSLERLHTLLARSVEASAARARTASFRATAATALLIALAALFIVLLARAIQRARSSLATADERALRRSERWFRSLVQNASELIVVVDPATRITYVTDSSVPLLGYPPERLVGKPLAELAHPDDADALRQAAAGSAVGRFECRLRTGDEAWAVLEWVRADRPDEPGCILTGRDVTDRKRLEGELRHLAFHDTLTGLANRALFEDRLRQALASLGRRDGGLAVLFVDLDDFKTVNDSLGHGAGDALLREAGERLRARLRDSDTAARLGGDEFAILLEGVASPEASLGAARRVLAALDAPFEIDGRQLAVTASVGVAPALAGRGSMPDLMRNADLAMYEAKSRGGGQCRLFEESMHQVAVSRLELGGELQQAIEEEQFVLHFQPIVDLQTGAIAGAEALVRWHHPERGLLAPGQFLSLAEETGLIVPLGRWVLEEATRTLRRWEDEHPEVPLYISANVSMRQLYHPGIVGDVRAALREAEVAPERLVVEITESVLADESEAPRQRLQQLRALGVRLAVDDFGTGYSALSYLQRFPIDVLKIDRSFVEHARRASASLNLVRSIVQLGQSLHLHIVAEGIEEADQAELLREMGVPSGQGYHFAKPLTAERFGALLAPGLSAQTAVEAV
jgi:diguanylate cyclase (GGDEF)-like protein/PAS domain S-box-containing protein